MPIVQHLVRSSLQGFVCASEWRRRTSWLLTGWSVANAASSTWVGLPNAELGRLLCCLVEADMGVAVCVMAAKGWLIEESAAVKQSWPAFAVLEGSKEGCQGAVMQTAL